VRVTDQTQLSWQTFGGGNATWTVSCQAGS
jgi:hypothetical protein